MNLWPIGNCQVSALIDCKGRFVWGCVPRVDGDPAFSSLMQGEEAYGPSTHGYWSIELEDCVSVRQEYRRNTPILVWNEGNGQRRDRDRRGATLYGGEGLLVGIDGLAGVRIHLAQERLPRVRRAEDQRAAVEKELTVSIEDPRRVVADRPEIIGASDERAAAPERTHAALRDVQPACVCLRLNAKPTKDKTAKRVT